MDYYELTGQSILRERFLEAFDIPSSDPLPHHLPGPDSLRSTERSESFETFRMNRKIMGALRYGLFGALNKRSWDRLAAMENKIRLYRADGNDEHLIDIANYAELEYAEGNHSKKHFNSIDDSNHCKNS